MAVQWAGVMRGEGYISAISGRRKCQCLPLTSFLRPEIRNGKGIAIRGKFSLKASREITMLGEIRISTSKFRKTRLRNRKKKMEEEGGKEGGGTKEGGALIITTPARLSKFPIFCRFVPPCSHSLNSLAHGRFGFPPKSWKCQSSGF